MSQCLNCNKPCNATTIFCDECRTSLLQRQHLPVMVEQERATQPTWTVKQPITPFTEGVLEAFEEKSTNPTISSQPARARAILVILILVGVISLVASGILLAANAFRNQNVPLTDMARLPGTGDVHSGQPGVTTGQRETHTPAVSPVSGMPTSTTGTGNRNGTGTATTATTPGAGTPSPTLTSTVAPTAPVSCVLEAAPAHLSFTATLLQQNPPGQTITLKTTGNCGQPVTWQVSADFSWVQFSSSSGSDNGSGSSVTVFVHANSIVGVYTAHITFSAVDSNGVTVQSNPQTITVTLNVIG